MLVKRLLDSFFPPSCLLCSERTIESGGLCPDCFSLLKFVMPDESKNFLADLPDCSEVRAAVQYDDGVKKLVLGLKYGDRLDTAPLLARMMGNAGREMIERADVLVPVPLHWRRLWVRKYNQAAVLADCIGKAASIPSDPFILKRSKATLPQGHFSKKERLENMSDAFCVKNAAKIKDKKVVLIDDVLTTGATLNACAGVLKEAGASDVFALTFACVKK